MNSIKQIIIFIMSNFGPLVGFYVVNAIWGFKAAVIISILLVFTEFFILKYKNQKMSSFFIFSSLIIIVFGIADLIIQEPFFFKFEAPLTNLFFAIFFGISLFKEKSIIQEFAEARKDVSIEQTADKKYFFKLFTIFWCSYFLIKAVVYLCLSFYTTFDQAVILRMIVGKVSFWIMMFISTVLPRQIWKIMEYFKLLPSQMEMKVNAVQLNNMKIILSTESDIPTLRKLVNAAYKQLGDMGLNYTAVDQDEEKTRSRISKGRCFILKIEDKILGTILYTSENYFTGNKTAYVSQFAVLPEHKYMGFGSKLMDFCENLAKTEGFSGVQ